MATAVNSPHASGVASASDAAHAALHPDPHLVEEAYDTLRHIAGRLLKGEWRFRATDATSLAHAALIRLYKSRYECADKSQLCGAAATAMRRILVERARQAEAAIYGGGWKRLDAFPEDLPAPRFEVFSGVLDIEELDAALLRLESRDTRKAAVVHLRCFGDLAHKEIGAALGVSEDVVKKEWKAARAWLFNELTSRIQPDA